MKPREQRNTRTQICQIKKYWHHGGNILRLILEHIRATQTDLDARWSECSFFFKIYIYIYIYLLTLNSPGPSHRGMQSTTRRNDQNTRRCIWRCAPAYCPAPVLLFECKLQCLLYESFLFELGVSRACFTRYFSSSLEYPELALRDMILPVGMVQDQLLESLLVRPERHRARGFCGWYSNQIGTRPAVRVIVCPIGKTNQLRGPFVSSRSGARPAARIANNDCTNTTIITDPRHW